MYIEKGLKSGNFGNFILNQLIINKLDVTLMR